MTVVGTRGETYLRIDEECNVRPQNEVDKYYWLSVILPNLPELPKSKGPPGSCTERVSHSASISSRTMAGGVWWPKMFLLPGLIASVKAGPSSPCNRCIQLYAARHLNSPMTPKSGV
ncbi:hypothetical protein PISMIDRAFT_347419 [Pisolithus microcarpus 441]|uniref:Uncharacterized protein n=1 Tax=Pisolithus microcarpus 441 TaxID=765257 RepID=A0A0C9YWP4_9AGAM|nr:hypothetical protein BKA83DRAFT_347419 [Pisolithus microcarpus]KIK14577.1 hypothetical protein PISMIDRAFT_347419 [Pisolithus microcarpus 441]